MTPYYTSPDGRIVLYHGDARAILPEIGSVDAVVTDPPWPGVPAEISGSDDAYGVFAEVAAHFTRLAGRVVVILGQQSDPRFLASMPEALPFMRTATLEYVPPKYRGLILVDADVAYIFGRASIAVPGTRVLPARCLGGVSTARKVKSTSGVSHPCYRNLAHMEWLIHWYTPSGATVLDPFTGSGTTALACRNLGRRFVGVELQQRWLDLAIERLERQPLLELEQPAPIVQARLEALA